MSMNRFNSPLLIILMLIASYAVAFSNNDKEVVVSVSTNSTNTIAVEKITAGEKLYDRCIGCHSPSYHRTGPKHCGIFGKAAGSDPDFVFTEAMKNSGIIWNETTLNDFLLNPLKKIPGTSMGFSGIPSKSDRHLLIAFLKSLNSKNEKCSRLKNGVIKHSTNKDNNIEQDEN